MSLVVFFAALLLSFVLVFAFTFAIYSIFCAPLRLATPIHLASVIIVALFIFHFTRL